MAYRTQQTVRVVKTG